MGGAKSNGAGGLDNTKKSSEAARRRRQRARQKEKKRAKKQRNKKIRQELTVCARELDTTDIVSGVCERIEGYYRTTDILTMPVRTSYHGKTENVFTARGKSVTAIDLDNYLSFFGEGVLFVLAKNTNRFTGVSVRTRVFRCLSLSIGKNEALMELAGLKTEEDRKSFQTSRRGDLLQMSTEIAYRVCENIKRYFTKQKVASLIDENPAFRQMIEEADRIRKRDRAIMGAVLTSIPESMPDLYPKARTLKRHFVIHVGGTNSGKTHDAIERLKQAASGVYLAPLRLLAYEYFDKMNKDGVICDLRTGEEMESLPFAEHTAATIEMLSESTHYDVAVIDEAQMLNDRERGGAWTRAILGVCADEVHICTAPHALGIIKKLILSCGDDFEIAHHERKTPLVAETSPYHFPEDVREGDALIVFSRRHVYAVAAELQKYNIKCSVIYGALPYDVRHEEARRFAEHENKVLVSTDAIGMGLNLPIKRIVFLSTRKFDGRRERPLWPEEVQQIAGRAGRLGIFDEGYFNVAGPENIYKDVVAKKIPDIRKAHVEFPAALLDIDAKLSELIGKWKDVTLSSEYEKGALETEYVLAKEIEDDFEDKRVVYKLIMLPFDERSKTLKGDWRTYARFESEGVEPVFSLPDEDVEIKNDQDLSYAEEQYKRLDLMYQYCRVFEYKKWLAEFLAKKRIISDRISEYLARQELSVRKCRICGEPIPWDFRSNLCSRCQEI